MQVIREFWSAFVRLLKLGWKLVGELGNVAFLASVLGITAPSFVWAWWAEAQNLNRALIALGILLVIAATTVTLLAVISYRSQRGTGIPAVRVSTVIDRDTWTLDAILYIATGRWPTGPNDRDPSRMSGVSGKMMDAMKQIRQRGHDGKLPLWGRTDHHSGHFHPIPHDYWSVFQIKYFSAIYGDPEKLETELAEVGAKRVAPIYRALKTSRVRVEELWPPQAVGATDWNLELARLRTDGTNIRNAGQQLASEEAWDNWKQHASDWSATVVEALGRVDAALAEWFNTLDTVPPPRIGFVPLHEEHARQYWFHDFRLKRLGEILERRLAKTA